MSKSLTGGGTVDLTLNSLSLVNITATNLTASSKVQGTTLEITNNAIITNDIDIGNNADITGDLNVGNNADISGVLSLGDIADVAEAIASAGEEHFDAGNGLTLVSTPGVGNGQRLDFTGGNLGEIDVGIEGDFLADNITTGTLSQFGSSNNNTFFGPLRAVQSLEYADTPGTLGSLVNVKTKIDSKQDTITAGTNLSFSGNTLNMDNSISVAGLTCVTGNFTDLQYLETGTTYKNVKTEIDTIYTVLGTKQNNITAGTNLSLSGSTINMDSTINLSGGIISESSQFGTLTYLDYGETFANVKTKIDTLGSAVLTKQDAFTVVNPFTLSEGVLSFNGDVEGDINLRDDDKIIMGASNDFQIYHKTASGNLNVIADYGAGNLALRTNGSGVFIQKQNSEGSATEHMIVARTDGAVELYHNASRKLETQSNGVRILGSVDLHDNNKILLGSDDDAEFYHNGGALIFENSTGEIYYRNKGNGIMTFQVSPDSIAIMVLAKSSTNYGYCSLRVIQNGTTTSQEALRTTLDANNHPQIRVPQIDFNGNSRIKYETQEYLQWYGQASDNTHKWRFNSNSGNPNLDFRKLNGDNGCNIRALSYSNISDDRMKSNETPIENATDTLLKLKPMLYDEYGNMEKSNDPIKNAGLIAQKIYYDAPELRPMVKLNENENGTIIPDELSDDVTSDSLTDEDYINYNWGEEPVSVNYTYLIPYLVKTIQELNDRISVLENN